ncbi:MAG: phosphoribosylamine--glycine ligase [Chloroflexota bacterium]|nr:phosphoribosylamine--glycine ligase [Chloroflexota bacterium]
MRILVIGNGAREHAIAFKLLHSPLVDKIFVVPGNAGTKSIAENVPIAITDSNAIGTFAQDQDIQLTIVGPEAPLSLGIVDHFESLGLPIFGPTKSATLIESSKVFAKQLMEKYHIPCAKGRIFNSYTEAITYVESHPLPLVIKADGLAAGKGVVIAQCREEARHAVCNIMKRRIFGAAGDTIIIDECLEGNEVSLIAVTDGKNVIPMVPACDYKRVFDEDQGTNTGGMGSYSPPSFFGEEEINTAVETILEPTVAALAKEGIIYRGVLYAGLMLTDEGMKVLEFNARFGDPETQVILPRLKSDLMELLLGVTHNTLTDVRVEWINDACVGVIMASGGYPGQYQTGYPIVGLEKLPEDILVFHAGTKHVSPGVIQTDGGRVLTIVGTGSNIAKARANVYSSITQVHFENCHYRTDIASREIP